MGFLLGEAGRRRRHTGGQSLCKEVSLPVLRLWLEAWGKVQGEDKSSHLCLEAGEQNWFPFSMKPF